MDKPNSKNKRGYKVLKKNPNSSRLALASKSWRSPSLALGELGSKDRAGTELGVPSSGDLERSLIRDPRAPLRQDPVPLILLSWVPLKPELILNPGEDRFLRAGESRRDDTGNGFLKISLVLRVPRTEGIGSLIDDKRTRSHPRLLFDRNAAVGEAPPPPGGNRLSPVGPLSVIGVEEVINWRKKFRLPGDVTIRIPGPFDKVSDFELGREDLPWTAESSLLEDLDSYAESRYHLHPRGKVFPMQEISKAERKRCPVFEGCWTSKFAFMSFPRFSPTWCAAGRDTIEQLLELPLKRCEVSFLVSDEALDRCSIRGLMSGSKGDEALAEYKKALEAMSARRAAVKRTAPVEDEEVQFVGSSRHQVTAAVAPSSSKKKSKASGSVPKTPSPAPFDWSAVLSNLNAKAFPLVPARLSLDGDSFAATRSL
ncbi:hypothetical protein DY000_02023416 [Brassica cretica]|uniref:Uncharacterized protein n=1 Tax=Brassica cretica TaxID=69181 RepID=A0ABQ7EAK4_BRACR|nr:hypothetical protein DY000_02023416 [Brassica cretica]